LRATSELQARKDDAPDKRAQAGVTKIGMHRAQQHLPFSFTMAGRAAHGCM